MKTLQKAERAGHTAKISVSLDRDDLTMLRRRARRLHGGNVSAAIAEAVGRLREEEGRQRLVAWLGESGHATPEQQDAIRVEWTTTSPPRQQAPERPRGTRKARGAG